METLVTLATVIIPSVLTLVGCMINNNMQRAKEFHSIEMQIQSIIANYDKSTALIQQDIIELSERVNKHNNLTERMYTCEDRLNIVEHDISNMKDDGK